VTAMNNDLNRKLKKTLRSLEERPVLRGLKPVTDRILRVRGLEEEAEKLRGCGVPVILFGVNRLSLRFHALLRSRNIDSRLIPLVGETVPDKYAAYTMAAEDLIYLKDSSPHFYSMSASMDGVVKSRLLELGLRPQSVKRLGYGTLARIRGCWLADGWDPLLGSVRTGDSELPGYTVFRSGESDSALRILVLGGSTSDPTLMNLKSWPEYLFDSLCSMGIETVIFNGAVGGYCSAQEMKKLLRDLPVLRPDLVISLSGVNDAVGIYTEPGHPLYQREDRPAAEWLVKTGKARNGLQDNVPLKKVDLGPADGRSLFQVWLDNERCMHAICTEFGAEFHAFLQPVKEMNSVRSDLYREAKTYFARSHPDWLHDLSRCFDDDKSVYADFCHFYEKGSRKLGRHMLRIVLENIDRRDENITQF